MLVFEATDARFVSNTAFQLPAIQREMICGRLSFPAKKLRASLMVKILSETTKRCNSLLPYKRSVTSGEVVHVGYVSVKLFVLLNGNDA